MTDSYSLIIGGRSVNKEHTMPVLNKYTLEPFAYVSQADSQDVADAISSACLAKQVMADMPAHQRSSIIRKAAEIIESRIEEFTDTIVQEAGKPYKFARAEVERCIENLIYTSEEAKRIHGETVPVDASTAGERRFGYYDRFPVGVVAAISPFNFPLNLAAHKIAPAVAAGCPVILKPASTTPVTGIKLIQAFVDAGAPEGSVSAVIGSGSTVGQSLIEDSRISKISFTGSKEVGEHIVKTAGLKKVTMELGSNSAVVIDGDIKCLDYAVRRCVLGAYYNQGQVCISVQRIFVHKDVYSEFLLKYVSNVKELNIGDPGDKNTDIGPMISETEAQRVENWVNEALEEGASIATGGKREGVIYYPTVITNATRNMKVMSNELFGPVAVIYKIEDFEEGLKLADDSDYGLQAGVFTSDINKAMSAVNSLNVGGVIINDFPTFRVDHMPYGGNKGSGLGREGAKFAIEEMTTLRMVVINQDCGR